MECLKGKADEVQSDWYSGKSCALRIDLYCLLNYGRVNALNASFCTPVTIFLFFLISPEIKDDGVFLSHLRCM